jgi:hypothetical protein
VAFPLSSPPHITRRMHWSTVCTYDRKPQRLFIVRSAKKCRHCLCGLLFSACLRLESYTQDTEPLSFKYWNSCKSVPYTTSNSGLFVDLNICNHWLTPSTRIARSSEFLISVLFINATFKLLTCTCCVYTTSYHLVIKFVLIPSTG